MTEQLKRIRRLQDKKKIMTFTMASSVYVLRKIFAQDIDVIRLIHDGPKVVRAITREMQKKGGKLHETTMAAYAYILEQIDAKAAAPLLKPFLRSAIKAPGPYFVQIVTHTARRALGLPVKAVDLCYTRHEMVETLKRL